MKLTPCWLSSSVCTVYNIVSRDQHRHAACFWHSLLAHLNIPHSWIWHVPDALSVYNTWDRERAQMPHTIIDYNIELHYCFGSETVSNLCLSLIFFFACNRFGVMSDCKLSWLCFSCCLLISLRLFETCRKLPNTFWWISIYISFGQKRMWKFVFITGLWLLPRWLHSHNPAYCVHVVSVSAQSFNMWSFLAAKTKQRTVSSLLLETMFAWFVQSLGLSPSWE